MTLSFIFTFLCGASKRFFFISSSKKKRENKKLMSFFPNFVTETTRVKTSDLEIHKNNIYSFRVTEKLR